MPETLVLFETTAWRSVLWILTDRRGMAPQETSEPTLYPISGHHLIVRHSDERTLYQIVQVLRFLQRKVWEVKENLECNFNVSNISPKCAHLFSEFAKNWLILFSLLWLWNVSFWSKKSIFLAFWNRISVYKTIHLSFPFFNSSLQSTCFFWYYSTATKISDCR